MKKRKEKRTLKRILAVGLALCLALPGSLFAAPAKSVQAGTVDLTEINLLANADMEDGTQLPAGGMPIGQQTGNWHVFGGADIDATVSGNGDNQSICLVSSGSASAEQDVLNLTNDVQYTFSIWARAENAAGGDLRIGIKGYGGSEQQIRVDSNDWKKYEISFKPTQGMVRVYAWMASNSANGKYWIDNASLTTDGDLTSVTAQNGTLSVNFREGLTERMSADNFSASYTSSIDPSVKEAVLTQAEVSGSTLLMTFPEIEGTAVDQDITMNLLYLPLNQNIQVSFQVEKTGEQEVTAEVSAMTAKNGSLQLTLDNVPTVAPVPEDFSFLYAINGGEAKVLSVSDFQYNKENRTIDFSFIPFSKDMNQAQNVVLQVLYKNILSPVTASLIIEQGQARTYYVAADGDDINGDGTIDKPYQSIDKLNTIEFVPGDQILFKKGDTFKGAFMPKGSGAEGAPIVMASYGDGDKKPVLKPADGSWTGTVMSLDAVHANTQVNNLISFYNQSYWEVRDLELAGNYEDRESSNADSVYNRAINLTGEDAGELTHYRFDNLTIHNFWGPNSNIGKSSGGILMEVIATPGDPASDHISTSINDIRIENCEMYNLGRSGINFVSVWGKKTDETDTKWGPGYPNAHGARRVGYTRNPYNDFYLGNNYIHHIQGDGCIVDTCDDAVVENNLVEHCCMNTNSAAVGLFNWNSYNTVFQANEVAYTHGGGDAQGIEIDALNDTTYVQYNYIHDNKGGSMMWCAPSPYYSFNSVYRYNIFQNDEVLHGIIDYRNSAYDSIAYNNVFYIPENAVDANGKIKMFGSFQNGIPAKMYNNIFYYAGSEAREINTFSDNTFDWRSNVFYNISNLPAEDDASYPNFHTDPALAAPGSGTAGTTPGAMGDVSGYMLKADSPAINAGIPITDNGGRDFFNNPVAGIPDIGVYETGSVTLEAGSSVYTVDQFHLTITIPADKGITAQEFLSNIAYDTSIQVRILRNGKEVSSDTVLKMGDTVELTLDEQSLSYIILTERSADANDIPVDKYTMTAGSEELVQGSASEGPVRLAADGKANTIWHSSWSGAAREDLWIQVELDDVYLVTGLRQLPRSGGGNGTISKYRIETKKTAEEEFTPAGEGEWNESGWQNVVFANPVEARYIRLYAVESKNNFASAAEIRITGTTLDQAPAAPENVTYTSTHNTVILNWDAAADAKEYRIYREGILIGGTDGDVTSYKVTGLEKETEYTFQISAVNRFGYESRLVELKAMTETDKTALRALYDQYKDTANENYTDATWDAFQKALTDALSVLNNKTATAGQAKTALDSLENAYKALAKNEDKPGPEPEKPDTSKLTGLYNQYKDTPNKNYTDDTWKAFQDALSAANALLQNPSADQASLDKAYSVLSEAFAALKEKDEGSSQPSGDDHPDSGDNHPDNNNPSDSGNNGGGSQSGGQDAGIASPKTGDIAPLGLIIALACSAMLVLFGTAVIYRKREDEEL